MSRTFSSLRPGFDAKRFACKHAVPSDDGRFDPFQRCKANTGVSFQVPLVGLRCAHDGKDRHNAASPRRRALS